VKSLSAQGGAPVPAGTAPAPIPPGGALPAVDKK
jgi:hypothetical protein